MPFCSCVIIRNYLWLQICKRCSWYRCLKLMSWFMVGYASNKTVHHVMINVTFSNSIWNLCLCAFISSAYIYLIIYNSCITYCITTSTHSRIFSFSAWSFWIAILLIAASANFSAWVIARVSCLIFNRFPAFSLAALRIPRVSSWFSLFLALADEQSAGFGHLLHLFGPRWLRWSCRSHWSCRIFHIWWAHYLQRPFTPPLHNPSVLVDCLKWLLNSLKMILNTISQYVIQSKIAFW